MLSIGACRLRSIPIYGITWDRLYTSRDSRLPPSDISILESEGWVLLVHTWAHDANTYRSYHKKKFWKLAYISYYPTSAHQMKMWTIITSGPTKWEWANVMHGLTHNLWESNEMKMMAPFGPINVLTKMWCCRWPADALAWAHWFLSGCCRWLHLGPFNLPRGATDYITWAHSILSSYGRMFHLSPSHLPVGAAGALE